MKHISRYLVALTMAAALLCCGSAALAAEETAPNIQVQLDGQALTFTDAVPQVKDQRTFLPFRAVFEAMGADVSTEGSVITAVRGGKTLAMTLNETTATLTEGDKTTSITMDVAPYVDNATWRTYVPVRFAAQAFDCAVGWDQENSTVILVDVGLVLDDALEGKSFTYLEKLADYSKKYSEGVWDMDASFDGTVSMLSMPMTMAGTMKGTVADSEKMSVDMNMKMDMSQFLQSAALLYGEETPLSAEDQAMLDSLKEEGIDMSIRGDLGSGLLYMNMKGALMETAGMSGDAWYSMDMAALFEESGMNWTQLLENSKNLNYLSLAKSALATLPLTDSATAYDHVKQTVEQVISALSDEGFVKEGNDYTALLEMGENDAAVTVVLSMRMDGDAVTEYVASLHMEATQDNATIAMDATVGMDNKDQMTAEVNMNMAEFLSMEMSITGSYKQGTTAPQTQPPQGATVIDLNDLAAQPLLEQ